MENKCGDPEIGVTRNIACLTHLISSFHVDTFGYQWCLHSYTFHHNLVTANLRRQWTLVVVGLKSITCIYPNNPAFYSIPCKATSLNEQNDLWVWRFHEDLTWIGWCSFDVSGCYDAEVTLQVQWVGSTRYMGWGMYC